MRFLLDTQMLLWAAEKPEHLSAETVAIIEDAANELTYSLVSLWEVAIKSGLGRSDFQAHPLVLKQGFLENGYRELAIRVEHMIALMGLPLVHRDPFDRMLVAQAATESLTLLTADALLGQYAAYTAVRVV